MLEQIIIIVIIAALTLIFRNEIEYYFTRILSQFAPELNGGVPAVLTTVEKIIFVLSIVIAVIVLICLIAYVIRTYWESKIYNELRKKDEELKKLFTADYNVSEVLEQVERIELLPETVEENYYHHAKSTDDKTKWGVYVGHYFLKCNCTVATFRCVELLRVNGVPVMYDARCIYEKADS